MLLVLFSVVLAYALGMIHGYWKGVHTEYHKKIWLKWGEKWYAYPLWPFTQDEGHNDRN